MNILSKQEPSSVRHSSSTVQPLTHTQLHSSTYSSRNTSCAMWCKWNASGFGKLIEFLGKLFQSTFYIIYTSMKIKYKLGRTVGGRQAVCCALCVSLNHEPLVQAASYPHSRQALLQLPAAACNTTWRANELGVGSSRGWVVVGDERQQHHRQLISDTVPFMHKQ